ncbi:MAG: hypothetical protein QXO40_05375 [Candidatus Aenigmatarchaeota archaeon]
MNRRDLIDYLDLREDYEEFKKVMDEFVMMLRYLELDEDVFVYKFKKYFEREKKIILILFLEEWEGENVEEYFGEK